MRQNIIVAYNRTKAADAACRIAIAEQAAGFQEVIEDRGFGDVALRHGPDPARCQKLLQHELHDIDAPAGRRIVLGIHPRQVLVV